MQLFSRIHWKGTSANAGPHYQKLYARVTHIWGNRRGQPSPSAMKGPHPERTASMIIFFGGGGPQGSPKGEKRSRPMASCGKPLGHSSTDLCPGSKNSIPERDAGGTRDHFGNRRQCCPQFLCLQSQPQWCPLLLLVVS